MENLSKEQSNIVSYNNFEGALLVQAAAGSGKTRILTERVRRLLTDIDDKFFSVLCLTFTNKAAEEMKERLHNVPKIRERAFIGTFHEFCLGQILIKQKIELGFTEIPHIFDDNDKRKVLENIFLTNDIFTEDYVGLEPKEQQRRIDGFLKVISEAKRNLITESDLGTLNWSDKRKRLYREYNDRMFNQSAMDYDDILLYAYRILTERPRISSLYRRRYKYILVDEAQDLNYSQYQILKALCGNSHNNIVMVGDPNQAIYSFNGSSIKYMQEYFIKDFAAVKLEIQKNYRSSDSVLSLAKHIKNNVEIGNNFFKGKVEIVIANNESEEAKSIVSIIKEYISRGIYSEKEVTIPISYSDIAVIARNRYIFKHLQNVLDSDDELAANYHLRQGNSNFKYESKYINLFDLGLRLIVNPSDVVHLRQICKDIYTKFDVDLDRRDLLLNINQFCKNNAYKEFALNQLVLSWKTIIEHPNRLHVVITDMKKSFLSSELSGPEQLKIDYDLDQIATKWTNFQKATNPKQHNVSNFRHYLALNSSNDNGNGVTLSTIHASKGLEFEVVILMGLNEGVLPSYRAKTNREIEEERNTAYVAVTRAKKCIHMTYPIERLMPWGDVKKQTPSRFIKNYSQNNG
ncbi:MAG: ATP-dependent helicase [Phaeodactylibacter sp.]|uniref:ATP-dependent helicase n=1 Tax=Phaeodactylibacter sp. TaxID=1940289 RepID=UPI0032EC08E9